MDVLFLTPDEESIAAFLREHGFSRVKNLAGGILAWSDKIDPTVPKY